MNILHPITYKIDSHIFFVYPLMRGRTKLTNADATGEEENSMCTWGQAASFTPPLK